LAAAEARIRWAARVYRIVLSLLGVGVLVTVAFMFHAGEPRRPTWWLGFIPFVAWALLPYGLVGLLASRLRASSRSIDVLAAAASLLSLSSSYLLYLGFVAETDAQSGLLFLFVPLWQLVALVPVAWLANTLGAR
jgi:hypothetical protein